MTNGRSVSVSENFDRRMNMRAPGHLANAVELAAATQMQSVSSWLRQAALAKLETENGLRQSRDSDC